MVGIVLVCLKKSEIMLFNFVTLARVNDALKIKEKERFELYDGKKILTLWWKEDLNSVVCGLSVLQGSIVASNAT